MIGDAYMVLAGGPVPSPHHAESITNYGLGILEETAKIIDPSTNSHLKIRVGKSKMLCDNESAHVCQVLIIPRDDSGTA